MDDRTFDWKPNPDPRQADYPLTALLATEPSRFYRYHQVGGPVLNQGREGACVGHGVTAAVQTSPLSVDLVDPQRTAFGMYYGSRRIDQWEGEDYSGTSVQAGCKLAQELGFARSYWWCKTVEDVAQAVLTHGPVVIGVPWLQSMFRTDENGTVTVSGEKVGGHCLLITGYNRTRGVFRWRNSWGLGYGIRGDAWITVDDYATLFAQGGEAAVLSTTVASGPSG